MEAMKLILYVYIIRSMSQANSDQHAANNRVL